MFYQQRAQVYANFLAKQSAFVHFPAYENLHKAEELYLEYLHAYQEVQLFASAETYSLLTSDNSPNHSIQRMRTAIDYQQKSAIIQQFSDSLQPLLRAMRQDLKDLSSN